MKKVIYYIAPFIILPIIFLLITFTENIGIIKPNVLFILTCFVFAIFSAIMGSLSLTNMKFDYFMTLIVPTSMFFTLFVFLLFDEGCSGNAQLSLHHALNGEYYRSWLPITIIMTIITFVFSFKPIRIAKKFLHRVNDGCEL